MSQRTSSQRVSNWWTTQRSRSRFGTSQDLVLAIRKYSPMTHNVWRSFPSVCRIVILLLAACLFFASHAQAQPTALPDAGNVNEGATVNIDLAGNDIDNGGGKDLDSITIVDSPTNGAITSINPDGTVDYTHDGSGTTIDSFTYTITDTGGNPSTPATVNVIVNLMNDPPIAVADVVTLPLGSTSTINIMMLANDTDEETPGTVSFTTLGTCDPEFVVQPDDSLDYTPPVGFQGTALCTYNIDDGTGLTATGTVSVTMIHPSPICDAATSYTLWDGGTPPRGSLSATSTNPSGDVASWVHTPPTSGAFQNIPDFEHPTWHDLAEFPNAIRTGRGGGSGAITTITFPAAVSNVEFEVRNMFLTPGSNENQRITGFMGGTPVFPAFTDLNDGAYVFGTNGNDVGGSLSSPQGNVAFTFLQPVDTVEVRSIGTSDFISVVQKGCANDTDDTMVTPLNTPVTLTVTANDTDSDGTVDVATVDLDPVTAGQQTTFAVAGQGTFTADGSGNVTFTPTPGFVGTSTIPYTVNDNEGRISAPANISVTVVSGPAANNDAATTAVNTPVTLNIIANDIAGGSATLVPGTLDLNPGTAGQQTTFAVAGQGTFASDGSGNVTFTPDAGFISGSSTAAYTINDNPGTTSNIATITITIDGSLNPPTGLMTVNPANLPELEWRMVWINNHNAIGNLVRVTAAIPAGTTFIDGSLTCNVQGNSTLIRCDFEPAGSQMANVRQATGGQVVYEGLLEADSGATGETDAANEVVITFLTLASPTFSGAVQNQGQAQWDANNDGSLEDEIAGGQAAVLSDDPGSANPGDATFVTVPTPVGACLFQVRDAALAQSLGDNEDIRTTRQASPPFTLTTPLAGQVVAGSSVAVAAIEGPGSGTTVSAPITVNVANNMPPETPDIIESSSVKTEVVPGANEHVVVTAEGVLVSIPAAALDVEETLIITEVNVANAPGTLPGGSGGTLVDLALESGQTQFASPLTLRIPYDDADQNGNVDGMNPAVAETALSLWRFDAAQGIWVQLPGAIVVPESNALLAQITQSGLFGLFEVASATPVTLGASEDDIVALGTPQSSATNADNAHWGVIDTVSLSPFVAAWNATALADGAYELRAVCADDPTALQDFINNVTSTGSSSSGGGCSLTPGVSADPTLILVLSALLLYLGWRRMQRRRC
jgi:CshA-type fibril repeat protein